MVFPLIPVIAVGLITTGCYGIAYKTGKLEANSKKNATHSEKKNEE